MKDVFTINDYLRSRGWTRQINVPYKAWEHPDFEYSYTTNKAFEMQMERDEEATA